MAKRITRRALGMSAMGAAAFAEAQEANTYRGALDGFDSKVKPAGFDTLDISRKMYESAPLKMTFRATNRKDAEAWQKRFRAKLTELVGGFPERGKAPAGRFWRRGNSRSTRARSSSSRAGRGRGRWPTC